MFSFEEACEKAFKYFNNKLYKALETKSLYIFYGGDNRVEVGGYGISINRNNGELKPFILPSKENFKILNESKECEIPLKYR